jgi:hypothetical protein
VDQFKILYCPGSPGDWSLFGLNDQNQMNILIYAPDSFRLTAPPGYPVGTGSKSNPEPDYRKTIKFFQKKIRRLMKKWKVPAMSIMKLVKDTGNYSPWANGF